MAQESNWRVASVQQPSKYPSQPDVVDALAGETLYKSQLADEDLRQVAMYRADDRIGLNELSKDSMKILEQLPKFVISGGVLCRQFTGRNGTHVPQSLIPFKLREEAAKYCHVGLSGVHLGTKKTLDQVQQRFFWPTWKTDVAKYCRHCLECKRSSRFHQRKHTNVVRPHFVDVLQSGLVETVVEPTGASVVPTPVSPKPDSDARRTVDNCMETSKIRSSKQPEIAEPVAAAEVEDSADVDLERTELLASDQPSDRADIVLTDSQAGGDEAETTQSNGPMNANFAVDEGPLRRPQRKTRLPARYRD